MSDGIFNVRNYGAVGDGETKDTAAIQAAIDAAAAAGGGEVRVPAGRYVTGTLYLKSHVDFNVCAGATIEASKDPADYNPWDVCPQNSRSAAENHEGGHLFLCVDQTDVTLRGAGTVFGNGRHFMTDGFDRSRIGKRTGVNGLGGLNAQDAIKWRPSQMLWFCECDRVRLEGLHLIDSPYWTVLLHGCEDVAVHGLVIRTSRDDPRIMNGDGLNIDCCRHVRVSDCDIETSDDSLCLRADGKPLLRAPCETAFVTVTNCTLSSCCEAFRIGVGDGPIHDCVISNCVIRDSRRGINFSSTWFPSHGCDFADIRFDNIVSHTIASFLRIHRLKATETSVRGLHFSNISGTQGEPSYIWSRPGKPFEDISLVNVDMDNGIEAVNVEGFRIEGGTLREIVLSPDEYAQRSADIDAFRKLLY
jgi:polygalacturonase